MLRNGVHCSHMGGVQAKTIQCPQSQPSDVDQGKDAGAVGRVVIWVSLGIHVIRCRVQYFCACRS